jgi:hypothetical protein
MGNNAYKQRHREQGLCLDCSEAAETNGRCAKHAYSQKVRQSEYDSTHRDYRNAYQMRFKIKRREAGLCPTCGGPRDDEGFIGCCNCREHIYRRRA